MKRPLLTVALGLIAVAWIRLATGGFEISPELQPEEKAWIQVRGRICQKEEQRVWLDSVSISNQKTSVKQENIKSLHDQNNSDTQLNLYHSDVPFHQNNPYPLKLICETGGNGLFAQLPLGTCVLVEGQFSCLRKASNPGEFDEKNYFASLGAGGRLKGVQLLARGKRYWPVREAAARLREILKGRIYGCMSGERAGVMSALLLGDKSELDPELKELYKRNGILHILSISSLHITIIGMSLYRALRRLGTPVPAAAILGAVVLLFYGAMTGFSVSATRAIGMYLMRMLAELWGCTYDTLTALGTLALLMVLDNPYRLLNAGFLLSFMAVFGIGILYPLFEGEDSPFSALQEKGTGDVQCYFRACLIKLLRGVRASVLISLSISLVTLPVLLWFYYEVPVFSTLLNLFILPCMKPLLILGGFCMLPGFGVLGGFAEGILSFFDLLCRLFDRICLRTWNPGRPGLWGILLYYLLLILIVAVFELWKRRRRKGERGRGLLKPDRFLMWILLFCNVALLGMTPWSRNRLTFLDVGQGDCILISTASGENLLMDCGSSSRKSVGERVLLPCLKYYGIDALDGVMVSHPDRDHINGILELMELAGENGIQIKRLILPGIDEQVRQREFGDLLRGMEAIVGAECRLIYLSAGEELVCGEGTKREVRLHCLHPQRNMSGEDSNAYSLCVLVDFGQMSCLLTGDAEREGEKNIMEYLSREAIPEVTLLKCAHHGSRNGTSAGLLQGLLPKAAVISCGSNNSYGHPHREVLERLQAIGTRVLRTDRDGAIIVTPDEGGGLEIKCYGK